MFKLTLIVLLNIVAMIVHAESKMKDVAEVLGQANKKLGQVSDLNASVCGNSYSSCQKNIDNPVFKTSHFSSSEPSNKFASFEQTNDSEQKSNFLTDKNPERSVETFGCISGEVPALSKCYPSATEALRSGKLTIEQLSKQPAFRYEVKSPQNSIPNALTFEFHQSHLARQDVGLTIYNGFHNSNKSDSKATEVMFIPRKKVPIYSIKSSDLEITLANEEKMTFDSNTGKLKSGVLKVNDKGDVSYTGRSIMIKTSGVDGHGKSFMEMAKKAYIYKDGKTCEVKTSELWDKPQKTESAHFKFENDKLFYDWLSQKSKCFRTSK